MLHHIRPIFTFLFLCFCPHAAAISLPAHIRVLLAEYPITATTTAHISAEKGLYLWHSSNPEHRCLYPHHNVDVCVRGQAIYVQGSEKKQRKFKFDDITCSPAEGHFSLNQTPYQGTISIKIDRAQKKIFVINTLLLEDYVCAVLRTESYPHWPLAMHKIQAISSRTFGLHHVQRALEQKLPYDVKNSNFSQTYQGLHEFEVLRQAVDETKHVVLMHKGNIILAQFDACCGGIVPAQMSSCKTQQTPYLARREKCSYCKKFSLYRWKHRWTKESLRQALEKSSWGYQKAKALGTIKDVAIAKKDTAGVVKKIRLVGSRSTITLTASQFRSLADGALRSERFTIDLAGNGIIVQGKGMGHGKGLCQHGARELVRRGWDLKKILAFYYPGARCTKLTSRRASSAYEALQRAGESLCQAIGLTS